jgi:hypothetical protein
MEMHTHFLRDDTRIMNFVAMRSAVGKAGWNKQLADKEQTIEDLKFCRPRAEGGIVQGLYDRRQYPQGDQPLSVAHGRRASGL